MSQADIKVFVDEVLKTQGVDYTFANANEIDFASHPASGAIIRIERQTPNTARTVDFQDGAVLSEADLDNSAKQNFFIAQEAIDTADESITLANDDKFDAQNKVIKNVADPVNNTDAVNKQFISTNIPNITTVAGIAQEVTNVAGDATDIGLVAGQISPTNNISTVAGLATEIGNLGTAQTVSDINTLAPASVRADMDTLADISGDITTVAGKASLITSDFVSDLNTVAVTDVINDINTLATSDIVADLNTLGTTGIVADLNTLAAISTDVTSLANAIGAATTYAVTVANGVFYLDGSAQPTLTLTRGNTYIFDQSDNSNSGHPLAFRDSSDNSYTTGVTVTGSAGNAGAKVTIDIASNAPASLKYYCTVHGNGMGNNITVVNSNLATVASNITNVNNVGGNIGNVNNVSASIGNVNSVAGALGSINLFGERYRVVTGDPTEDNDEGDLIYNSTDNQLKYFNGTSFVNATTASITNGTFERQTYTVGTASGSYDGSTTVFPITYDAGFVDVYLNGVKLAPADFTATNGTTVTLGSAAGSGDTVDMVAYGIFNVGNINASNLTSGTIPDARFPAILPAISAANLTSIPAANLTGSLPAISGANLTGINTDLAADTTPQLGGNLDVQTHSIVSTSNQDITLTPDGTGNVVINTDNLQVIESADTASQAPNLDLRRISASPADNDLLGAIRFYGKDSSGQDEIYGKISVEAEDVTNGVESSTMHFEAQPDCRMQLYRPNSVNKFLYFLDEQILHWEDHKGTNSFCRLFWETPSQNTHVTLPNIQSGTLGYCALSTTNVVNAPSVEFTNLPTNFDTFYFVINAHPVNDAVGFRSQFLDTSGNAITASNSYGYYYATDQGDSNVDNATYIQHTGNSIGSANYEGVIGNFTLQGRNFTTASVEVVPPTIQGQIVGHYNMSVASGGNTYGMLNDNNVQAINGIKFYFSSGNIAKANVQLFGIQNT